MRLKAKEMRAMTTTRTSMKGLQEAIAEGWLVQRARDMCSFTHDRHYHTACAMADALPEGAVAGMSLRVIIIPFYVASLLIYRLDYHSITQRRTRQ